MKLIKLEFGMFKIVDGAKAIHGNWGKIESILRFEYDIKQEEIDLAFECAEEHGDDIMHFGVIRGMFTHSSKSSDVSSVLAELKAIRSLREEFSVEYKRSEDGPDTRAAWDRLVHMYMVLNVNRAIELLDFEDLLKGEKVA